VTAQLDYNHFDGTTLTALPRPNDLLLEAGYLISSLKLMPVVQINRRDLSSVSLSDETRVTGGANYGWAGHNANVKALYTRISPNGLASRTSSRFSCGCSSSERHPRRSRMERACSSANADEGAPN
jgi:hypothetical protein